MQRLVKRAFKQLPAVSKPVMPITKAFYTGITCQFGLPFPHCGIKQVVVSQLTRNLGLDMTLEERLGILDARPLGETGVDKML